MCLAPRCLLHRRSPLPILSKKIKKFCVVLDSEAGIHQAMGELNSRKIGSLQPICLLVLLLGILCVDLSFSAEVDINEDADDAFDEGFDETSAANNTTMTSAPPPKEGSIADMIDRVLEKEFSEKDHQEGILSNGEICVIVL